MIAPPVADAAPETHPLSAVTAGGGASAASRPADGSRPSWWWGLPVLVALGLSAGMAPVHTVVAVAALGLLVTVVVRPAAAAWLWMLVTPLIVGVERGRLLPGVRLNEALLVLLFLTVVMRWVVLALSGRMRRPTLGRIDLAFLVLMLTGAVLPLLWMLARGRGMSGQDVQAAAVIAKYYMLFVLFRLSVRTEADARRCLLASLAAGVVVAVLAVLQSLGLFGVPDLVATYWASGGAAGRGSSTVGNAHGAADLLVFNLAIALALGLHRTARGASAWPLALAGVFLLGALGSGQASAVFAVLVTLVAVGWLLGQLPRIGVGALLGVPMVLFVLAPVIDARLRGVDPSSGLPSSWLARWENLSTYFWPQLFDGYAWLLGVQVVPEAAGKESWQPTVYIENGHTWLLWIGGVPYLLAFLFFVLVALRIGRTAARHAEGAFAVAGVAVFSAYGTVFVLTALDPHLFLRGSADLAVPLLALASVGLDQRRRARRFDFTRERHLPDREREREPS